MASKVVAAAAVVLLTLSLLSTTIPGVLAETVLTALVDHPNFSVIELTTCSVNTANLNVYSIYDFQNLGFTDPDVIYKAENFANVPLKTRIYLVTKLNGDNGLDAVKFKAFFNFTPPNLYFSDNISIFGNDTVQLLRNTTVVDTYGTVLVDNTDTANDFSLGWVKRKTKKGPSANFNGADWIVTPSVYANTPAQNSLATTPIVFGTYDCNIPCFSESNTVEVEGKGTVTMNQLEIGDKVKDAKSNMASVYSFAHYLPNVTAEYLQIYVKGLDKPLEVSSDHLVFSKGVAVPASTISVGDEIDLSSNATISTSTCAAARGQVEKIREVNRKGVYAPLTTSGTIAVSGVAASSYITLQSNSAVVVLGDNSSNNNKNYQTGLSMHWLSHVFQTPHRWLCSYVVGMSTCRKWETYTDDGISRWADLPYQTVSKWLTHQEDGMVMAATVTLLPTFVLGLILYAIEEVVVTGGGWLVVWIMMAAAVVATLSIITRRSKSDKKKQVVG